MISSSTSLTPTPSPQGTSRSDRSPSSASCRPSGARGFFSARHETTGMQIGIISDTHDNVPAVEAAMERFAAEGVDALVHCGDFVAPPVIPHLDREGVPVHAVRGNNDGEREGLREAFASLDGGTLHGRFAELAVDGVDLAVLHGERRPVIEALAASGAYDYVLHGHWHVTEQRTVGDTTVLNPGAHFPTVPDDHRTVAVLDTADAPGQAAVTVHDVEASV